MKRNMNKKQGFRQVLKPVFVNASELPISKEVNILSEETPNNLQEVNTLNPSGSLVPDSADIYFKK